MQKKLVVVTPVQNLFINNGVSSFNRLCDSIKNQTWKNILHLIVAGPSTDDTDKALSEYATNSNVQIIHGDTKNKWSAMNVGLEAAQGDYIQFLEYDAFYYTSDAVEKMITTMEENNADYTFADCWLQPKIGNKRMNKLNLFTFYNSLFVPYQTIICRLPLARDISDFDDNFKYTGCYDYMIQLFLSPHKGIQSEKGLICIAENEYQAMMSAEEKKAITEAFRQEKIAQVQKFFTGIADVTAQQLEFAVTKGGIPNSFLNAVCQTAHPWFRQVIEKKIYDYQHKFDDFLGYWEAGLRTVYIPLYGMGDGLLFTGVAKKIFEQTGQKVLVAHKNKELFKGNPYIVATDAIYDSPEALGLDDIQFLNTAGFDIMFSTYWESYPLNEDKMQFFFTYPKQPLMAQVYSNCGGSGLLELKPELFLTDEEKNFGRVVPRDRKQIAIMSSAIVPRKQYPYFQQIIDALKDEYDFVQIGAPEDDVLKNTKENLAGKLTLRQTASVLYNSDLFVGEIGGLMHMARAVDCPAVIAYSSSEPDNIFRYSCNIEVGPKNVCKLSQKGVADKNCMPCMNKNPYCCCRTIPVEKMIKAIHKQIKRGKENLPVETVKVKPNKMNNSIKEYLRRYNAIFKLDNL